MEENGFKYDLFCFYQDLLKKQKSLGSEFEKVLYENLEDLLIKEESEDAE